MARGLAYTKLGFTEYQNLSFKKTGLEIKTSLNKVITDHSNTAESSISVIKSICADRGIEADEVLQAKDEVQVAAYETKLSNSLNNVRVANVINALQADIDQIRQLRTQIEVAKAEIENLKRIQSNIEPDRVFDLSYSELVNLGF